jgi:hypothetical protein
MSDLADDFNPEWHALFADLVTDHPFVPHPFEPDACAWDEVLWPCGYSREEHADKGEAGP